MVHRPCAVTAGQVVGAGLGVATVMARTTISGAKAMPAANQSAAAALLN